MSLAYKISAYNRNKKWKFFLDYFQPSAEAQILDIGFSDREYSLTDNYLEKHYAHPENITALGIEEPAEFKKRYPLVKVIRYSGRNFPLSDKQFDIAWSNAVLEHVGSREDQVIFLKEINRVAETAFVTTPNRNFPIETHTRVPLLHFLPKSIFDKILRILGKDWATGEYMNLLNLKELKQVLKQANIKDYKIIKNRLGLFTLDFIIIFGTDFKD